VKLWKAGLLVLLAAVIVVTGLVLAGVGNGLALLAYVLFVAAVLFAWLIGRLTGVLSPAPDFERLLARRGRPESRVEQLETVKRWVTLAGSSRSDLLQLQPVVREIAAARLSRRYGIDLDREPERARSVLDGSRTWQLVGPESRTATDRRAPGWSRPELEQLVEELENL
jgi:hypothetical protein